MVIVAGDVRGVIELSSKFSLLDFKLFDEGNSGGSDIMIGCF